MASKNPVLRNIKTPAISDEELARIVNGGQLPGQATMADVTNNTFAIFGLVAIGAFYGWSTSLKTVDGFLTIANTGVIMGSMVVALILGLVNSFKKVASPVLILGYGLAEGVMLGGLSHWIDATGYVQNAQLQSGSTSSIAQQALIGTVTVFVVMLALYRSKIIKVTGRFQKMFMVAMTAYFFIAIASMIAAMAHVGNGWGFFGVGQLGILLCVFGVGLAAFSLVMDFEAITQAIGQGIPKNESWRLAFGLTVSLVWLYTELLRLLAILNRR